LNRLSEHKILKNLSVERIQLNIFDILDSTNEECKRINQKKQVHVIISEEQTQGKGRLGKSWSSPKSGNIYMSIAFKGVYKNYPLSLIAGIICKESICTLLDEDVIGLKWPNDLIFLKKKVGGILVEKEIIGNEQLNIIGIGLNLYHSKKESWWGDLSSRGLRSKRNELINSILIQFMNFIDNGMVDWDLKWQEYCIHMRSNIKIKQNNIVIDSGLFNGINKDGSMSLLSDNNKSERNYPYGEISIEGVY
jgi:BirA family biotin operon repressor/biotin-[acetyl-CoA-carboxylase] ligase